MIEGFWGQHAGVGKVMPSRGMASRREKKIIKKKKGKKEKGQEEAPVANLLSCTAGREGRRGCGGRSVRLLCKQQLLFPPFQQLIRI